MKTFMATFNDEFCGLIDFPVKAKTSKHAIKKVVSFQKLSGLDFCYVREI